MAGEPQDPIEELLAGYALNALTPEEWDLVERALAEEPRYQVILSEYLETVAQLAAGHTPVVPSGALRDRRCSAREPRRRWMTSSRRLTIPRRSFKSSAS